MLPRLRLILLPAAKVALRGEGFETIPLQIFTKIFGAVFPGIHVFFSLIYGEILLTLEQENESMKFSSIIALSAALLLGAPLAQAVEQPQEWELVNPAGVIKQAQIDPAKRITSLDGKTVALRWNGKNNGNVVLDRIGELLNKRYPSVKVVKTYTDTSLNTISGTPANSERIAKAVAAVKPDLVIASQGD